MADIESPDRVGVKVWPDTRDFLKDLRATLKRVEKQVKANIPVVADAGRLVRDVKESAKAAEKAAGKVEVPAELEDGFVAKMRRDLKAATASLEAGIPLTADGERLRRETRLQVAALQAQVEAMAVDVPVDVESAASQRAELAAGIAALQAQARANPVEIPVTVDSAVGERLALGMGKGRRGIFSAVIGDLGRLAAAVPVGIFKSFNTALEAFTSALSNAIAPIAEGGKGMSKLAGFAAASSRGVGALVTSLGGIIVPLVAGVGAIVLFTGAIGGTASALSLLTGMLTAFVGTLGTAIIAPVLAAIPLMVSFGAGAAVAAGGIAMWAKQSKEVKKFLPPIKNELKGLADQLAPTLDGMTRLFGKATVSLIRDFGDSVEVVLEDMYAKMRDPRMDKFYDQWSVKMPSIFEELGKAIASFGSGLTAFFVPILPYAEQLAMKIRDGADRFNDWATSASGQNAIADWMREAWEIAGDLWSGLKDIGGAIGDIMGIGVDESGGQFAQWVRDIGSDFKKWTESKQGREDIRRWFKDAEKLAGDVRYIVEKIGDAFDKLDSPAGRAMLGAFMFFLKGVATYGSGVATVINGINTAVLGVSGGIKTWMGKWQDFKTWLDSIDWSSVGTAVLEGILSGLGLEAFTAQIQAAMSAIGDAIVEFFKIRMGIASPSKVMIALMADVGAGIVQGLLAIPGTLLAAAMSIGTAIVAGVRTGLATVGTVLAGFPSKVMGALVGLRARLTGWATTAWSGVTAAFGPAVTATVGWFTRIPGRIGAAVGGLRARLTGWATTAWSGVTAAFGPAVAATVGWFRGVPGRIAGAVSGLAGRLGGWASTAWSRARAAFGTAVGATVAFITGVPGRIVGALSGLGGRLSGWASGAWGRARSAFGAAVAATLGFLGGVPGRVIGVISGLGGRLASWASGAWSRARSAFTSGVSGTLSFISGVPGRVIGLLSGLGGRLSSWATSAWAWARSATSNGIVSTLAVIASFPGRAVSALGNLGGLLYSAGASLVQGLIDGISSKIGALQSKVGSLATTIRNHMPGSPVKEGPLRDWNYGNGVSGAGRKLVAGLAEGMDAERSSVAMSSRLVASAAMPAASPAMASGAAGGRGSGDLAAIERVLSGWQPVVSIGDRDFYGVMKQVNHNRKGR